MWSEFLFKRYVSDKHQAYMREAAHDWLLRGPRAAGPRTPRVKAGLVLAVMAGVVAVVSATRLVQLG